MVFYKFFIYIYIYIYIYLIYIKLSEIFDFACYQKLTRNTKKSK